MEDQSIVKQDQGMAQGNTFGDVFTTVDLADRKGKNAILRALNDAESLAQATKDGSILDVVDFAITPGERRDGTACWNVYIITMDGRAFFTQSEGIFKSVQQILTLYPEGLRANEDGCVKLIVRERTMGNGNTLKSLVPVD